MKCFSSSTLLLLQNKHNLSDKSVLGLVCLPFWVLYCKGDNLNELQ